MKDKAWFFGGLPADAHDHDRERHARAPPATRRRTPSTTRPEGARASTSPANQTGAARRQPAHAHRLQQQLEQARGPAAGADGHRRRRHQLRHRHRPTRTGACRARPTGWRRRTSFVGVRAGYYISDRYNDGVPTEPRYIFSTRPTSVVVPACRPSLAARARGLREHPHEQLDDARPADAPDFQVDRTFYANCGGQHTDQGRRAGRPRRQQRADRRAGQPRHHPLGHAAARRPARGTYGYYSVRSNGVVPEAGLHHRGRRPHEQHRAVHPGRLDDQQQADGQPRPPHRAASSVPAYTTGDGHPRRTAIEFSFADKLAPRVGFAYDIKGDGRWKAFGSWGVFYDIFKLRAAARLVRRRQVARVLLHARHLRLADTLAPAPNCPPACAGTLIRGPIDFRHAVVRRRTRSTRTSSRCSSRKRRSASSTSSSP